MRKMEVRLVGEDISETNIPLSEMEEFLRVLLLKLSEERSVRLYKYLFKENMEGIGVYISVRGEEEHILNIWTVYNFNENVQNLKRYFNLKDK